MGSIWVRAVVVAAMAVWLVACGDEDSQDSASIAPGNHPPVIDGDPNLAAIEGKAYEFLPTASDPDGDALIFNVSGKPGWMQFDSRTGRLNGTPKDKDVGKHRGIVVSVSDGQDEAILQPIDIDVLPAAAGENQAPDISGMPSSVATVDSFYDFIPTASDADGDTLSFQIVNRPGWAGFDPVIGRLSGTPRSGDIGVDADIVIRVSDGISVSELGPFVISVNAPAGQNSAPTISGIPDPDVVIGETWAFTPQATDVDADTLSFAVFNAPPWTNFDPGTGSLSGAPGATDVGRVNGVTIVVTDGEASASLPAFAIEVIGINTPPTIVGSPSTIIDAGQTYTFTPVADDDDGDALAFSIANRPAWASFNASTGTLSGVPGEVDVGTDSGIRISVGDGQASASLPVFSIQVRSSNSPPSISGNPATSVLEGSNYSFVPTATDPDGDSLTYSITNRPDWAGFDTSTGAMTGTPGALDVGMFNNISIHVSDGQKSDSLSSFSIEVIDVNIGPTISGSPGPQGLVDQPYAFTPQINDPDGGSLSFSVQNLPVWAGFNPATGTISGTPTAAHVGTYSGISITVSDGPLTDTLGPFSVEILDVATGTATLSWQPPTENTDGSPLQDLAGYIVYWGTESGNYPHSETIASPGATSFVVTNLLPGQTYFFAVTAYNNGDLESGFSNEGSKSIQ
jgi:hypothetical protein